MLVRACVNCRFCIVTPVKTAGVKTGEHHICASVIDPVTGAVSSGSARKARGSSGICGREAWLFERKEDDRKSL
jgi:hypothetical protein